MSNFVDYDYFCDRIIKKGESMEVLMSIYERHVEKIVSRDKNHEFRNYIPKEGIEKLYIYTTSPVSKIEYIATIDKIVTCPEKISFEGTNNDTFNRGEVSKHAYHISEHYRLENPITLKEMKEVYKVNPPQGYTYVNRNKGLKDRLSKEKKIKVF